MKLTKEIADKFIIEPKSIELNIYTDIDLDAAKVLYKSKFYKLDLSGIKKINIDILKLIVKYKGWLILDGISEINEKETSLFELHTGTLHLNGINQIKLNAYKSLMKHEGDLYLKGLNDLNIECLDIIKQTEGRISFNDTYSKKPEIEKYLKGNISYLNNIIEKRITKEIAADFISDYIESIKSLDEYTNIDYDAAKYLVSKKENGLDLNGITSLEDEKLKLLSKFRSDDRYSEEEVASSMCHLYIRLNGLREVSDNSLISFFLNFKGHRVGLNGLKNISNEVAEAISKYRFDVSISGVQEISDEVAYTLSQKEGLPGNNILDLSGIKSLSNKAANYLSKFQGELFINGLEILDETIANELSQYRGLNKWKQTSLRFPKIKELDKNIATEFINFPGNLHFDGLINISTEVAKILGKWKSNNLTLDGIESINSDAFKYLVESKIKFSIHNLKRLNTELIKIINQSDQSFGFFNIEEISQQELELIDSIENRKIYIHKIGKYSKDLLPLLLRKKIRFKYSKLDFDIDSYQEVVDYIKEDRYNIENINIDNKESFIDDFIIYLVESNQIEILDIINPLFNGAPTFNSLTIIDEKIMKSIMMVIKRYGKRHSHLYLNNIEKIDCETLQILESETKDFTLTSLYLNGLKALALKEFEILSNCKIGQLYMNSISYLPAGAAKHLSNLSGLFKAEIETDKYIEIEQLTKMIVLNGIKEIDVEFSLGFKSFNGTLILDSLEKLNDDLIDLLSNCNENLSIRLSGIKNLDDNKIIAITNFRGADMSIKGLSYISDQAMEYFAKTKYSYLTKIIINSVFHLHRKHFNRLDYIRNQIN